MKLEDQTIRYKQQIKIEKPLERSRRIFYNSCIQVEKDKRNHGYRDFFPSHKVCNQLGELPKFLQEILTEGNFRVIKTTKRTIMIRNK